MVGLGLALASLSRLSASTAHANAVPHGIAASDGYVGDRVVTAYDVDEPAIARLDPQLRSALRRATSDAAEQGVHVRVNSGWRSRAYQRLLFAEAVTKYGDARRAREWVNTPSASTHVTGDAVDVGPPEAAHWLGAHGSAYGLCQVYANEPWHFELLTRAGGSCPPPRRHVD